MAELGQLMDDIPEDLLLDGDSGTEGDEDAADESASDDETDDETDEDDDAGTDDSTDDETDDSTDDAADDDYITAGDEEEDNNPIDAGKDPAKPAPAATDENTYILSALPKISVNVLMPTADGKGQEVKAFQVYGWGDMPKNMLGFVSPYEQGVFTASAQNNETRARELQNQYRTDKVKADTEAYTMKENRGIANDLKALRTDGLFPKFKGVPGSAEFNGSDGAKEFDRVIAFMNEQNDEAGRAAQSGSAFYHISFRQAYRMLHPEQFDAKRTAAQRTAARDVARRVKSGGGTKAGGRNVQTTRVTNITDLADEFAQFSGGAAK